MTALSYPHARNDCGMCREHDADVLIRDDERELELAGKRPSLACLRCLGRHLALQALGPLAPDGTYPQVTVSFALTDTTDPAGLLAAGPPIHRHGQLCPSFRHTKYPHRFDDCCSCRAADAAAMLTDLPDQPVLCIDCLGWNVTLRAAHAAPDPRTATTVALTVAPSRLIPDMRPRG